MQVYVVQNIVFAAVVPSQQRNLLWCAATLMFCPGVAEYALAALLGKLLHSLPGQLRSAMVIDCVGVTCAYGCVGDTLNTAPVVLHARDNDQKIVVYRAALGGIDLVESWVNQRNLILDPLHARWHIVGLWLPHIVCAIYTATYKCKSWLIVLAVAGVDDSDVGV